MSNLFWLSDAQMERLKPFFPNSHGKPRVGNRRVLSGIIFINRNGLRWCDAPKEYGPHKTLYTRVAISDVAVRRIISSADTFFIATLTTDGADVSHRGGMPGALHQNVDGSLSFPDYAGNQYFNTLGNIEVSSRAGLFIPDFASGEAILLTGKAGIDWSPARAAEFEGAERVVDIHPEDVWYARHALPRGVFTEE